MNEQQSGTFEHCYTEVLRSIVEPSGQQPLVGDVR